jgi:ADP-heptose:LPS heptosyltransferase
MAPKTKISIYSSIKKLASANRLTRFIDGSIRLFLSLVPLAFSVSAPRSENHKVDSFIFFLHGGLGDSLMTLDLINYVSSVQKVFVLCDFPPENIAPFLGGKVKIIQFSRPKVREAINEIRSLTNCGESVFVQTSPVIECFIISRLLKIRRSIGFLTAFSSIRAIGIPLKEVKLPKMSSVERLHRLGQEMQTLFNAHHRIDVKSGRRDNANVLEGSLIVISVTKSEQWRMGRLAEDQYVGMIDALVSRGYKIALVGTGTERKSLEQIRKKAADPQSVENHAGSTSVEELSVIIKHARFIVANDNGIAHLAGYLRARVLVLFMFSDPDYYKWPGENYKFLFKEIAPCMPCVGFKLVPRDNYPFRCPNGLICNQSLSAELIIDELKRLTWIE